MLPASGAVCPQAASRPLANGTGNLLKRMEGDQQQISVTEHPFTLEDPCFCTFQGCIGDRAYMYRYM